MNYTISVSSDGKYVILKVHGDINRQTAMEQNIEAHALGKKMGINRYLVDVTEARNTDTPTNSYHFAYNDMQKAADIDRHALVATLVSPSDHSHDFIETVSINSGLNVKIFTDLNLAKAFLLSE